LCVKERRQGGCVFAFHCRFVLVGECFFLRGRGGHYAEREREYECASYCKDFRRGFHGRHRSWLDFRNASQFEKEKSLLSPAARAIPLSLKSTGGGSTIGRFCE
jgi:hypothetical protein